MNKVSSNENEGQVKDTKSNSSHVSENSSDSMVSLEPPALQFQTKEKPKLEEENGDFQLDEKDIDVSGDDGSDSDGDGDDDKNGPNPPPNKAFNLSNVKQVKQKFEQQFGHDLSDTKVIQNSKEPSKYNALAFAKGSEVHLGPGQEHHLGHELAHVIQQKKGYVNPTGFQNNNPVNEDPLLEAEADKMSYTAMQLKTNKVQNNSAPKLMKPAYQPQNIFQFEKPKGEKEKKVEKKMSLAIPAKKIKEQDFKYVKATLTIATGLEVSFMVDASMANYPDEVAIGEKGLAFKKEGPNIVSKEIEQKLNLEVKNGLEINSFGGKVGMDCKLGEKSIFSGVGVEFSFIDVNWSETDPLDKIKILNATIKSVEHAIKLPFNFNGETHTMTAKIQPQVDCEVNKVELIKQIVQRFGHLFTGELAIAGGMVLAGAATIAAAVHNIMMGKEIEERVENLINQIISYGKGFKSGYTGSGGGGSFSGFSTGIQARIQAYNKMPPAVFDTKIKSEGMGSTFSDAMYQAVQTLKNKAIEQFKIEHDVDEDSFFKSDLVYFKRRLGYLCESKYLRDRLSEI